MKQRIRLSESTLHKIIKESVKSVLRENEDLDTQENLYQVIANLEQDLKTVISNTDFTSNQAFGSSNEKLRAITNSLSHVDNSLAQHAKTTFTKLLSVISELQDIRISLKTLGAKDSYWGHDFKTSNGTVGLSNYH